MKQNNLTDQQLNNLDTLFDEVSARQLKDFGNISASNKPDGSLITDCDLWSDTKIEKLINCFQMKVSLVKRGEMSSYQSYWIVDPLDGTTNFAAGIPMVYISSKVSRG